MKRSDIEKQIEEIITEILGEAGTYAGKKAKDDLKKDPDYSTLNTQAKIDAEKKLDTGGSVTVGEAKDKDNDSSKIKDALAKITKEMKTLASKFKEAEGNKKRKIKDDLKKLTTTKNDLEKKLDKSL